MKLQSHKDQEKIMSDDLAQENDHRNTLADAILNDLIEIARLQGDPIKKMKVDEHGVFYVESEIPFDKFIESF
jgi:hypothetical protein